MIIQLGVHPNVIHSYQKHIVERELLLAVVPKPFRMIMIFATFSDKPSGLFCFP